MGRFSKFDRAEVNALFSNRVQQLGISSIASVCFTDTNTVELILQEILASIVNLGKQNTPMRLNFKVGTLIVARNTIQW